MSSTVRRQRLGILQSIVRDLCNNSALIAVVWGVLRCLSGSRVLVCGAWHVSLPPELARGESVGDVSGRAAAASAACLFSPPRGEDNATGGVRSNRFVGPTAS